MPAPLVMRFSAPRPSSTSLPTESRWRMSPANGQVTVCSPMCGCGSTRIRVTCGPKRSRKHQAPTSGRSRWGSDRCTDIARTPPSGTSRDSSSSARGPSPSVSAGSWRRAARPPRVGIQPCHLSKPGFVRPVDLQSGHVVAVQVAHDERAARHDRLAATRDIRECAADQDAAESLALERRVDLGVREDEAAARVGRELREPAEHLPDPDLVAVLGVVALDAAGRHPSAG